MHTWVCVSTRVCIYECSDAGARSTSEGRGISIEVVPAASLCTKTPLVLHIIVAQRQVLCSGDSTNLILYR